jgi:uncharacterized damage-inducible protein DinB
MTWAEHFQARFAYNAWANQKIIEAASTLSDEDLARKRVGTSYGTLADDLTHLSGVQRMWGNIAAGEGGIAPVEPPAAGIVVFVREQLAESQAKLDALASGSTNESLDATVTAKRGGETYEWPRWQVLEHLANHSAHHRAEIGQALFAAGANPGDMDFVYFVSE